MIQLSIIIPCYNAEPYIDELMDCLNAQMADSIKEWVEIIVIDDGSEKPYKPKYNWVTLIRQKNKGASAARNAGLDRAKGEYIAFIDADDLVAKDYIQRILMKISIEKFDYCYLSWHTFGSGWKYDVRLKNLDDKFPPFNLCVWNRIYKRSMIGKVRFNEKKKIAEDAEFIRAVHEEGKRKAFIGDYMVMYRTTPHNSLTQRFGDGLIDMRRVIYYIPSVIHTMTYLIDEFRELYEDSEIILMTNHNEIKELEEYAMIIKPQQIRGTELRGEKTPLFTRIRVPQRANVILYIGEAQKIGGIETFMYNFCLNLSKDYDILVLYSEAMDIKQISRLKKYVPVMRNDGGAIICDTIINMRITEEVPGNVTYKKKIQMCHTCKIMKEYTVSKNNDYQVFVSEVAARSFSEDLKKDYKVINNLMDGREHTKALRLISATRLGTFEKGAENIEKFADALNRAGIKFLWLLFTDVPPKREIKGIIPMNTELDIFPFIKASDYLIQLSSSESFCYSIVEALSQNVAVITTPLEVLDEIGFKKDEMGYIVPFDLNNIQPERFLNIPSFEYHYDNEKRIKQWKKLLGKAVPTHRYNPEDIEYVRVKALRDFLDNDAQKVRLRGEDFECADIRAMDLKAKGLIKVIGG